MFADLHIHSIFSDSSRSPEEIVRVAKERNVSLISICDHYSIGSFDRLVESCRHYDLSCVSGVEMDANLGDSNYHVLAYNFDRENQTLIEFIKRQHDKSQKECAAMIAKMSFDYPSISLPDYLSYEHPVELGGWKYLHYVVDKGIFLSYEEAGNFVFQTYFEAGDETYPVDEFCSIVKKAKGIPVLAHPGDKEPDALIAFLQDMQEHGIEGIECFYPSHSKKTTEICLDYCRKNNLRITCGSDCHGDYDKSDGFSIGSLAVSIDMLDLKGIV